MQESNFVPDPKLLAGLDQAIKNTPQYRTLVATTEAVQALQAMRQELTHVGITEVGHLEQLNATIIQVVQALDQLVNKPDTEMPDPTQGIVTGLSKKFEAVGKQLDGVTKAIKALDVAPRVDVKSPDVVVPTPEVTVSPPDLSKLENLLNSQLPSLLTELIDAIPQPEPTDLSGLEQRLDKAIAALDDIQKSSRMKPTFPGTLKVTNPDGTYVGETSNQTARYDLAAPIYYLGTANVGSSESSAVWTVTKYDLTSNPYNGMVAIGTTWTGRTGASYG